MILFIAGQGKRPRPIFGIGLSKENLRRLPHQPIWKSRAGHPFGDFDLLIIARETEEEILEDLQAHITPETEIIRREDLD